MGGTLLALAAEQRMSAQPLVSSRYGTERSGEQFAALSASCPDAHVEGAMHAWFDREACLGLSRLRRLRRWGQPVEAFAMERRSTCWQTHEMGALEMATLIPASGGVIGRSAAPSGHRVQTRPQMHYEK